MEQHYRMTLADAIAKYDAGDITIKGLVHFFILIKCKPGWKIRIDYDEFSKEVPVSRSSFYHAISCLKKQGAIAWEAVSGILVSRVTDTQETQESKIDSNIPEAGNPVVEPQSRILDCESRILDCESEILDCESEILDCESRILDKETPKPPPAKVCDDSPDLYSDLDQLLNNSLSEQERESFVEFGKKKAAALPQPPGLPLAWIKKHFKELLEQWQRQFGVVSQQVSTKWENHPQKEQWLDQIRETGTVGFLLANGKLDPQRKSFLEWARAANAIWGEET